MAWTITVAAVQEPRPNARKMPTPRALKRFLVKEATAERSRPLATALSPPETNCNPRRNMARPPSE